ncbi:MAG: YqaJ viral recombinase family protein [Sandaracinaceae bacterium]
MEIQTQREEPAFVVVCDESDRDRWLEERRKLITASRAAAILGVGSYDETPLSIWAELTGRVEREPFTPEQLERFEHGHLFEDPIAELAATREGWALERWQQLIRSTRWPWLGATPDYRVYASGRPGPGALQVKTVGPFADRAWEEGPPVDVVVQVQQELAVSGYQWGAIAACFAFRRTVVFYVEAAPALHEEIVAGTARFLEDVRAGREPEPVKPIDLRHLVKLHPDDNGDTVDLSGLENIAAREVELSGKLSEVRKAARDLEAERDVLRAKLAARIGDATFGEIPGFCRYSFKRSDRKEFTVAAKTLRTLRREKGGAK